MQQEVRRNLESIVSHLAGDIGERSFGDTDSLAQAAGFIEERFRAAGCEPAKQPFTYGDSTYHNIVAEIRGETDEIIVVGAHYDTIKGTPGADDNASGVAGVLELARLAAQGRPLPLTLRLAAFCLEEPPVFRTRNMGSYVCARALKEEGARVRGMIALEMIGYFTMARDSQFYPLPAMRWLYPRRGNFIAFVGNMKSRAFTRQVGHAFRRHSGMEVRTLNTVSAVLGVDFSDHRSFWKFDFPAFMVTDTAFYRNPFYHNAADKPSTLDYGGMAEVVTGLYGAIGEMAPA